jgi:electron transfer flavoprotein alpha subunit
MLAVIPVREGALPAGGAETLAECGGRGILAGGPFAPARWTRFLVPLVAGDDIVVLPASPDGRDLAPRLAHALGRPLLAGATEVTPHAARLARGGGLELHTVAIRGPVVATLQPGVRGVTPDEQRRLGELAVTPVPVDDGDAVDADVVEVLAADVTTMDLAEADRIVGGGAGLDGPDRFVQLRDVAARLGASMGATRVVTDRGWVEHQRQIGTTGVVVDPSLYVALGISGAVQHTAGLGAPRHIISVNVDAHCPMMQLADLGVVADANAVLDELLRLLVVAGG